MDKCTICGAVAKYTAAPVVTDVVGTTVLYCEDHMLNAVTTGADAYQITKLTHTREKRDMNGTMGYIGLVRDQRAPL